MSRVATLKKEETVQNTAHCFLRIGESGELCEMPKVLIFLREKITHKRRRKPSGDILNWPQKLLREFNFTTKYNIV